MLLLSKSFWQHSPNNKQKEEKEAPREEKEKTPLLGRTANNQTVRKKERETEPKRKERQGAEESPVGDPPTH